MKTYSTIWRTYLQKHLRLIIEFDQVVWCNIRFAPHHFILDPWPQLDLYSERFKLLMLMLFCFSNGIFYFEIFPSTEVFDIPTLLMQLSVSFALKNLIRNKNIWNFQFCSNFKLFNSWFLLICFITRQSATSSKRGTISSAHKHLIKCFIFL